VTSDIKVFESTQKTVTHYRLPSGATVRIGPSNVLACLKCLNTTCGHVRAVRPFHRARERRKAQQSAGVGL